MVKRTFFWVWDHTIPAIEACVFFVLGLVAITALAIEAHHPKKKDDK